ncbi:nucleoside triphosphate pyrophosphohydrolase [Luteimonas deserti]|uniref:Nucleoside triphosphate pyrophosphohydrolase n=1 Tax=Luteimonas deserti TaxID=2752306 RepID=A0A7Z0QRB9_9GAMM|nr:nucleoside triphosphate pyrophosphohydrolase [Luteimonas deserti]NYZ61615.1 nucleoside triphosphate pyrophosphohydrolase [Luteimonas deserti]
MPNHDIQALIDLMARLRDPDRGCPWDLAQDFSTIAPYTVEEAYEVADAIDRGDLADLRGELGDLLFQVVFHARMAEEQGAFDFGDVVAGIVDKMVRRHPHIFAAASAGDADAVLRNWDAIKREERAAAGDGDTSALAGIARGLPEWQRAVKLQARAARVGFDWPGPDTVIDKLHEEIDEVRAEFAAVAADPTDAGAQARLEAELGDLLFVAANLARHARVDVGAALRRANHKFERRFRAMEARAGSAGMRLQDMPLDAQEDCWRQVKRAEADAAGADAHDPGADDRAGTPLRDLST